ncbi:hypothetical protein A7U60_g8629 [Sanghuangporus baumii]|uniref:Uncharacterized protein n=1 Tax=Sanghuangporus baumii TaxID=108892 RepID=A0A9Q5HRH2_SANBA|nr:hypothetical protein A7U60_g8629 [Sanghuangporus baumii]
MLPDKSEDDDDDFEVYEDLFVRKADAQVGELREEEQIQTTIKDEVVAEEPYCKDVVARANITEAVWDVVGRCAAEILTDVLPDKSEDDDDDFEVYEDLFVRKADVQAGELREEEWIQTAIKNEVVAEEPYCKDVVAWANVTKAVWDVVGRCAAEVWHEGIEDAEQFVRRAGGKELDAFISIMHPKVAGDDEVDLSNPGLEDEHFIDAHALIDSGCTVFNTDGTSNKGGLIKEYIVVWMFFGKHEEEIRLAVTSLASSNIFLSHDWLQKHNPEIDWKIGSVKFMHCPDECDLMLSKEEIDNEYVRNVRMKEAAKWIPYLEEYADVFSEESFEHLPNYRMWDHAIDLKLDFKPSDCKVYPLSPKEQEVMKEFIKENLASGCIRQSKSPMASPFFFIKKEDGSL